MKLWGLPHQGCSEVACVYTNRGFGLILGLLVMKGILFPIREFPLYQEVIKFTGVDGPDFCSAEDRMHSSEFGGL